MFEAILYKPQPNNQVQCHICQRHCVIEEGKRGYCLTRLNREGKLFSLIYGRVASIMVSPIEKKPVFHFFPGSRWLSLGSFGCNFRCPGCQNWDIAHSTVGEEIRKAQFISPEDLIRLAKKHRCFGISWTYNEPTLWFEYTLEGAKLAKSNDLFTNYVTNGFMTEEALDRIGPYLDVFRVDLKGFSQMAYKKIARIDDFSGILEIIKRAKQKWNMHVEVVTNIIPGMNDKEEDLARMASWILDDLGKKTPWHVTRFFPHLKLSHIKPTPVKSLEDIRSMGLAKGLNYVYLGNVWGSKGEDTFCPRCGETLITRGGLEIQKIRLNQERCPSCGTSIAGRFY